MGSQAVAPFTSQQLRLRTEQHGLHHRSASLLDQLSQASDYLLSALLAASSSESEEQLQALSQDRSLSLSRATVLLAKHAN